MFLIRGLPGGGPSPLYLNELAKYFALTGLGCLIIGASAGVALIVPNLMDVGGDCPYTFVGILNTVLGIFLTGLALLLACYYCYVALRRWWSDADVNSFVWIHWISTGISLGLVAGLAYVIEGTWSLAEREHACKVEPIEIAVIAVNAGGVLLLTLIITITSLIWGRKIQLQCTALLLMTNKHK